MIKPTLKLSTPTSLARPGATGAALPDPNPENGSILPARFASLRLLQPRQAAEALRCHVRHVYALVDEGMIEAVDIASPGSKHRCLRIVARSIERFALKQLADGPSRARPCAAPGRSDSPRR